MQALADERLTIEAFFDRYEGEGYELVDGRPQAMCGGSRAHATVTGNIFAAIREKLKGSPCEALIFEMGVRTGPQSIRYPDVVILCDPDERAGDAATQLYLDRPRVLIEVASPSTERMDKNRKLSEYKALLAVDTVVLVDPVTRRFETFERSSDREWLNTVHLEGASLVLRDPAVTVTTDEMFDGL